MYCNIDDVRLMLPEVTADILRDSTIIYFIEDAQERIDVRLRGVYDVPFTTAPAHIQNLCALYASYLTLRVYPDQTVEDDLERLWDDIDTLLSNLTNGKDDLGDSYKVSDSLSEPMFVITKSKRYRKSDVYDTRNELIISNESEDVLLDTETIVKK